MIWILFIKGNKGPAEIFYIINILKLKSYITNNPSTPPPPPHLKRKIKFFKIYNRDNNEEFKSVN